MNKTLDAYTHEHIIKYFDSVKRNGLTEHGFPRLTANIGILIANGYRKELIGLFTEMMDLCCESFPKGHAANDFSVKEIVFCILALEESGMIGTEHTEYWRQCLKKIVPETCYDVYAKSPTDKVYNWALFTAVSEYMRKHACLGGSDEFIDRQIASQLQWLDENGMYRDPNDPIVYDLVPRGLFSVLLHFGYDGKYRSEIDACLKNTGVLTLRMQSESGEIPYGGRSNQFLHNEAHFAIIAEYEAKRYAKEGNMALASRFKRSAEKALDVIEAWLSNETLRHVKNYYPRESKYGCESYAYFDKYMITAASFMYVAHMICDDAIPEYTGDENESDAFMLSAHFHKVFLRAGGYFLELDTNADPHYDASGLGRVHKKGAPSTVCLSVPCSAHPSYVIDTENAANISLSAGYGCDGSYKFATDRTTVYEVSSIASDSENGGSARCSVKNVFSDGRTLFTDYGLDENGVSITVKGENEVAYMLPVFDFDGEKHTLVTSGEKSVSVEYGGWTCTYVTDGKIADTGAIGCNRNGRYKAFCAVGNGNLNVKIQISKT